VPPLQTLVVGGPDATLPFCHRWFRVARIPANGELALALEDAGGTLPLDEWTALVNALAVP
jgi:hypothetical protein